MWKKSLSFLLALVLVLGGSVTARADEVPEETSVGEGIPVDETRFPDEVFRGFVLENCDLDKDGQLSAEEADAVTALDVSGLGIASLQGVELFSSLTVLECQNNDLTELDLTENRALEELRCYRNRLTRLDVSGCPSLRTLHCEKNALTSLDLAGNPKLTILQCQENLLSSLDMSHCGELDFLVCSDNFLPFLDVSSNLRLTQVQAGDNGAVQTLNENGVLDLEDIPGFDPDRASGWTHASLSETLLTPELRAECVQFTYDLDGDAGEKTAVFTWQLPGPAGIPIDEQHFPDAHFRLVVSHQLDTTPDALLTQAEIDAATRIEADNFEIASLEGLAYFPELRELCCSGNKLPFVDISANPLLTGLNAGDNEAVMEGNWDRTVDLGAIPGFDPARASGWDGGTVTENLLTVDEGTDTVRFTYDADGAAGEETVRLTWKVIFPERPEGTVIDKAAFPDEGFRRYVMEHCDPDGNGILSGEEIRGVTSLDVPDLGIASLAGAEVFAELRTLNCANNCLPALSLGAWPKLAALDCSFNALTELDLSENSRLETFSCAHNALSSLNTADCPELRALDCRDNALDTLDVSRNDRLTALFCGENRLAELDVGKCPELAELNCDYNRLERLVLPEGGSLKILSCNFNSLSQLEVSAQKGLIWLFVGGNRLEELDLSAQNDLEKLDMAGNPVASLDVRVGSMQKPENEEAPEETRPQETTPPQAEPCTEGHTLGPWIDRVSPSCAETGIRAHRDCQVCGRHFDREGREIKDLTLPKEPASHRHTEKTPRVEPTCTEDGFTAGVRCMDCDTYLTGHVRIPARHTLTPWIRAVKATDTRPGAPGHFDCRVCGKHFDGQGQEITLE